MDFDAHFQGFLVSTVNLRPYKLDLLDGRVSAITDTFQKDADVGGMYKEHIPQGSWAQQTIIEPVGSFDEFDADIILHLEQDYDWNNDPKIYLQQVRAAFKRSATYRDKVIKKNRCIRIQYAGSCHVDVVPSVTLDDGRQVIINYEDNVFEEANPVGFADWMKERDDLANGNLRRVIRLFKWLRDYKNTFTCPSVILTVMLGNRIQSWNTQTRYADIPTTLVNLLEDLRDWLDLHPGMPLLDDPSCPGTSFNHRWDDAHYQTFKKKVGDYATWAREAFDLQGVDDQQAITAWQKMFGEEFAADAVKEASASVVESKALAVAASAPSVVGRAPGEEFIDEKFTWIDPRYNARIDAVILGQFRNRSLRGARVVATGHRLRFHLKTDAPEPYDVLWKVRNHGLAAERAGDLRGRIRTGGTESRNLTIEHTKYPGRHYIEAYVVRNGVVVASDHHNVTIV